MDELVCLFRDILKQAVINGRKVDALMATQAEMVQQLKDAAAQARKTFDEIKDTQAKMNVAIQKIADLEAVIASGGDASPELVAAVTEVKDSIQAADDAIPDLTPPPTP